MQNKETYDNASSTEPDNMFDGGLVIFSSSFNLNGEKSINWNVIELLHWNKMKWNEINNLKKSLNERENAIRLLVKSKVIKIDGIKRMITKWFEKCCAQWKSASTFCTKWVCVCVCVCGIEWVFGVGVLTKILTHLLYFNFLLNLFFMNQQSSSTLVIFDEWEREISGQRTELPSVCYNIV